MKEKSLSVFLSFNGERGFFKELHIPLSRLRYGLASALLCGLLLTGLALDYVFSFSFQGGRYQEENRALKVQLSQVLKEVELLNTRLYQIEDFSSKIKVMAGVQTAVSEYAMGPEHQVSFPDLSQNQKAFSSSKVQKTQAPSLSSFQPKKEDYIKVSLNQLKQKSQLVLEDMASLMTLLYKKQDIMSSTPTILPAKGWISSPFGYRQYPFTGEVSLHEGLDIASFPGSPVYAPGAGVVMFSGYKQGYGKVIVVDHGYQLSTLYGHLSDMMVSKGQKVKRGQVIGAIGNTGNSSGPHLHYEVRISNVPVDPAHYILNHKGF